MSPTGPFQSVDYLIVGHLSADVQDGHDRLGGTAAYAGATAAALGYSVGAVTSSSKDLDLSPLPNNLRVHSIEAEQSTSFENVYTDGGRQQRLHSRALDLDVESVPPAWRDPKILHLAPIADEVDPEMARAFPRPLVGLTPQGWIRRWDASGAVGLKDWEDVRGTLPRGKIAILSEEDVHGKASWIEALADRYPLLIVTAAAKGARVYRQGAQTISPAPSAVELDPTGSGDIFAAAFFCRYFETHSALEAARFANQLASRSVERVGLESVPRDDEIEAAREQGST